MTKTVKIKCTGQYSPLLLSTAKNNSDSLLLLHLWWYFSALKLFYLRYVDSFSSFSLKPAKMKYQFYTMCCLQLKCPLLCFVLICLLAPANIATSGRRSDLQPMHSPPLLRYPPHRWSHIISYFLLFFVWCFFGGEAFILTFFLMDVFIGLNLLPLQYRWHRSRLRFMQYRPKYSPDWKSSWKDIILWL